MSASPSNFISTSGNGSITLNWSAVSGASSYNIYKSLIAGYPGTLLISITNSSTLTYTDTNLINGTTYYYEITSVDASTSVESSQSTQISGKPMSVSTVYKIGLKGFFYEEGSADFPQNFSPEKSFGFNISSQSPLTPLFYSSLNDIEYSFSDLREFSNPCFDPSTPARTDQLLLEASTQDATSILGNSASPSPYTFSGSGTDPAWLALYKILEYLYTNQTTIGTSTTGGSTYKNIADQYLSTTSNGLSNYYLTGSMIVTNSTIQSKLGRVSNVIFTLIMSNGDLIPLQIYFDPDDYITNSVQSYGVYCFNFSNPSNLSLAVFVSPIQTISNDVINNNIINEIFNIMKTGNYNIYTYYDTTANVKDSNNNPYTITVRFYVFARVPEGEINSYQWNNSLITTQIKQYIIESIIPDGSNPINAESLRVSTFPQLFTSDSVSIWPFYNNTLLSANGSSTTVNPVNLTALMQWVIVATNSNVFNKIVNNASAPIELFYVGQDSTGTKYRYPLLAVETDINGNTNQPISFRFNDYVPIDAQTTPDLTQNNEPYVIFQFVLKIALGLIDGSMNINSLPSDINTFMTNPTLSFNMVYNPSSPGQRDNVTFNYQGVSWTVYGYGRQS